jgi:UDP-glucose 4-epimerase
MKQKILVIGGSGFLGSHVCDKLFHSNFDVINFDRMASRYTKSFYQEIVSGIESPEQVRRIIEDHQVEIVYHLAGLADIDDCHTNPLSALENNILATAKILEACKNSSVKKIVFSSSAYVSSDKGSFYRISKKACEELFEEYFKIHGLKYVILRFGSLYGPRSNQKNGIYRLVSEAIKTKAISYNGTGDETREFIHVLDAAELAIKTLDSLFECQKILITGKQSIKFRDLLHMLDEMMGHSLKISFQEKPSKTHYITTPYAYTKDICRKLVGDYHVDLGQGLLNLIREIDSELSP